MEVFDDTDYFPEHSFPEYYLSIRLGTCRIWNNFNWISFGNEHSIYFYLELKRIWEMNAFNKWMNFLYNVNFDMVLLFSFNKNKIIATGVLYAFSIFV